MGWFLNFYERQWVGKLVADCHTSVENNIEFNQFDALKCDEIKTISLIEFWHQHLAYLVKAINPSVALLINKL